MLAGAFRHGKSWGQFCPEFSDNTQIEAGARANQLNNDQNPKNKKKPQIEFAIHSFSLSRYSDECTSNEQPSHRQSHLGSASRNRKHRCKGRCRVSLGVASSLVCLKVQL